MKKRHFITVLAAAAAMLAVPAVAEAKSFQDVGNGDWFYNTVSAISEKGIMTGMTDTRFGPGENLSRAQFATVLYRMAGSPSVAYQQHFPDVLDGQWYSKPVVWMYEQEIAGGYADGNFGPADEITREQMAKIIYSYQSYMGYDVSRTTSLDGYPDAELVSEFAKEYMEWAVAEGIISGQDNGDGQEKTLAPQTQASRGVTATIISRILIPFEGEYVISAGEAKEKIGSANVIFIDGRGVARDAETIKGAVISSWQDWSVKMNGSSQTGAPGWWKIMDEKKLDTTLSNLGLSKDKEIILLGETMNGWGDDARLMWELRVAGYENVKIVDGGYSMLKAAGAPSQKGTSSLPKADIVNG